MYGSKDDLRIASPAAKKAYCQVGKNVYTRESRSLWHWLRVRFYTRTGNVVRLPLARLSERIVWRKTFVAIGSSETRNFRIEDQVEAMIAWPILKQQILSTI